MCRNYGERFFNLQAQDSQPAAAAVVPVLLELFTACSALDVGGGVGAWAAAFTDAGVNDVLCVDGDYVDRGALLVQTDRFRAHDLNTPLDLGRRFDLVICLEVAEHLPPDNAPTLINSLSRHSDLVVFSAAIPQQGGVRHLNEQWPSYWREIFASHGYELFDIVRPRIWSDDRVPSYFRQNIVVYARSAAATSLALAPGVPPPLDLVHPDVWRDKQGMVPGIRQSLRFLKSGLKRRLLDTLSSARR